MTAITTGVIVVLASTSVLLLAFGVNLLFLTWRATRLRPAKHDPAPRGSEPLVCVQIPIYNERYVAARVIDAVCAIEWPAHRLEVQVLDDSDDETASIVDARVARWRRRGYHVTHVRRQMRTGFKAGALAHGMMLTQAPFIAIFDADFVPPADFLRRTMGVFADGSIGFVQARWGHLDEGYSWFTRLQALAIDFHFLIEQAVRSSRGYFTNFTGTAGVWRRAAIEDSGGWSAATLTEDLDLSYRAQLRGWRAAYLEDLVVPEELPVSIDAYRRQQSRWATGSFQGAFRLLIPVMRSRNRLAVKVQAAVHLLSYGVGPLMLLQLASYPWLVFGPGRFAHIWQLAAIAVWINIVGASPWVGFIVAQTRRGRPWWSGVPALLCQVIGAGMSLTVLLALVRALRGGGEFVRTPKYQIVQRGQEWRDQAYVRAGDPRALGDAVAGLGALALLTPAIAAHQGLIALYTCVFAIGFLTVATMTGIEFLEVMTLRRLGLRALGRLRAAAPAIGLLLAATLVLLAGAQMPQPFEDGFGHWLIAANLAATGHLHDPVFGMEDTWLPGYSFVAAAVLRVFGLWNVDALRIVGVGFGVLTLAAVYRLAANQRQGRLAVALLALNPVFLFTASTTVVEPLVTALLSGAALAATRSRWKLAAALAALACATSTKAWLFVGAALGYGLIEKLVLLLRRPRVMPSPSMGRARVGGAVLAIPLAALLLLPFASNSIARGSREVVSAIARGSLSGDPLARTGELISSFGLAALPLFAFAALGLVMAIRARDRAVRLVYTPAIAYLAVVVVLVAAGTYTGSHRYLYPALPSLALLAAAALDRQPAVTRLATAAAGGLLAMAFIPVFAGFAAANNGLIAAGTAVRGSPGALVTDSPVAAYYSGKQPADIVGSQAMPLDRDLALRWLRARGVSELVVENISYYRATTVFPELANGTPTPPFEPLGDQRFYQAPEGKQVYVYRTGAALGQQSLVPGVTLAIDPSPQQGKTSPLAKGCTLIIGGFSAAGEGMGLGVPIVRYPDGWVFPRSSTTVDMSTSSQAVWQRTFELDEMGGDAVAGGGFDFTPIASRGRIVVTYTVDATGITIEVEPLQLAPGYMQVGILNEESGAFNDFADSSQTLVGARFGSWVPVSGDWARLRSGSLGVEWSLPSIPGAQLYGGREVIAPSFDWAGLDYIFSGSFTGARYHINVQEAR
ncbi:MAG TPA: glycosyltransferase [Candidatus Dormibacteraeota bacterium]|nr:glycosyltransferase [Candidatus Dormibacteraeota bacterium]